MYLYLYYTIAVVSGITEDMASPKIPVKLDSEVEFAPLRTLTDFMLESARFQLPNLKDPERWMNRVNANLLYYQTNYFVMALLIFVIVGQVHFDI